MNISITTCGPEGLDSIRPLWEQLNQHHQTVSPHFATYFEQFTFEQRKKALLAKAKRGELRIFLAESRGQVVGQCIASIMPEGLGEIDSIYVDESFRGRKVGDALMQAALEWFDAHEVHKRTVVVVHGNDAALGFYARYGFLPRSVQLMQT